LAVLAVGAAVLIVLVGVLPRLTAQPAPTDNRPLGEATQLPQATARSGPSPAPTISGCGSPINPEVPRVLDETGLVEQCQSWQIASNDTTAIAVTNPDGDEHQLEVSWEGTRCEDFTSLTFRRSGQGFSLSGERLEKLNDLCRSLPGRRGVRVYLRDGVAASSITASLSAWTPGAGPPYELYAPPIAEVTLGSWRLAPDEHPTTDSTDLGVLVFDPDCSAGLRDPGQVQDALIAYSDTDVRVTFPVLKVQRPTCSTHTAVPMTIHLSEPLGFRQLIDSGGEGFVFQQNEHTATIVQGLGRINLTGRERARAMIRDRACVTTVNLDRHIPEVIDLVRFVETLGSSDGPVDGGRAWLGHASDAASYFQAIERYEDGVNYHAIVAAPEDLGLKAASTRSVVLTRLIAFSIGGRSIWYPAFDFHALGNATVFTSAPCG
jgi:hypothetical protein